MLYLTYEKNNEVFVSISLLDITVEHVVQTPRFHVVNWNHDCFYARGSICFFYGGTDR